MQNLKSVAFLYINNEASEREFFFQNPICNLPRRKKTPRNKFNQRGERPVLPKL